MSDTVISKTTFIFEVLHPADSPPTDLRSALHDASYGHAVGTESQLSTVRLRTEDVPAELVRMGNDGAFFAEEAAGDAPPNPLHPRAGFTYTFHQQVEAPFDEPEFYAPGVVVTVEYNGRRIDVQRDGDSRFTLKDEVTSYTTEDHAQLREDFPTGVIPDTADWANNGWFDLYFPDGEHVDSVAHSLAEAIADAEGRLENGDGEAAPTRACDNCGLEEADYAGSNCSNAASGHHAWVEVDPHDEDGNRLTPPSAT